MSFRAEGEKSLMPCTEGFLAIARNDMVQGNEDSRFITLHLHVISSASEKSLMPCTEGFLAIARNDMA